MSAAVTYAPASRRAWFSQMPFLCGFYLVEERLDGENWNRRRDGLTVIRSTAREADGRVWLHVSCSHPDRLPDWDTLAEVKRVFVGEERTALQVLPAAAKHVNIHPHCLHLWCCLDGDVTPDFTRGGATI